MSIIVCLFKGTYVIGVDAINWEGAYYSRLNFYRYDNGNLIDVTKSVVRVALPEERLYELPRYGRTIQVANQKRRQL